ncbi:MAG: hypothetical protein IKE76_05315, partial [Clostridia bacterium]|nr:hypothetical protein [Clostridia bacterium]
MPYKRPTLSRARTRARLRRQMLIGGGALVALVLLIVAIIFLVKGRGGDRPVNAPAATAIPVPTVEAGDDAAEEAPEDEAEVVATPEPTRAPTP